MLRPTDLALNSGQMRIPVPAVNTKCTTSREGPKSPLSDRSRLQNAAQCTNGGYSRGRRRDRNRENVGCGPGPDLQILDTNVRFVRNPAIRWLVFTISWPMAGLGKLPE